MPSEERPSLVRSSLLPAIVTSLGDQKPPVVTLPEYTEPIGTAGQEAPIHSLPEYVLRVLKDQAR